MKTYLTPEQIRYQLSNLRQLTFEVTDSCNLRCKYCGYGEFYDDYDKRENKQLSENMAVKLIDYLTTFWNSLDNVSSNKKIYIGFYGGEPLLNINFIKNIIEYIQKKQFKYRHFSYSMTTNAILLDKYIDLLVENKFSLLISLDGNAKNSRYRVDHKGNSSYEKVIENVEMLKNNYPEYFKNYVNFNSVLHNKNSVQEIYDFFKSMYDKIPSISELNNMGIREDKIEEFQKTYKNQQESLMQSEHYEEIEKDMFIKSPTYQTVCTYIHKYSEFVYKDYNELLYGRPKQNKWITGTCLPFNKKLFLTVNGKILPCERIGQQFALGEIDQNNNIKLDFEAIAFKYNTYFEKLENQCTDCHIKKSCIQCIFNLKNLEEKPICQGYTDKLNFEKYVSSNMEFIRKYPEEYYRIMEDVIVE